MGEISEDWVSLREFARRRGVSLAAVQKAIASGRVVAIKRDANNRIVMIEAISATAQWNGNTDVDQAARAGAPLLVQANNPVPMSGIPAEETGGDSSSAAVEVASAGSGVPAASTSGAGAQEPDDKFGYLEARARSEQFRAKQAELDYLEALGKVVSTEELAKVSARRYGMVRDKLLNIPDRTATLLAAERDPARVHSQLTAEIKRVLNELADAAESETTGGTAERVAA